MNSMINRSRLLAVALCVAGLAGCNAVEDVPDEPTTALPAENLVLGGHIKDLGSRRALVLQLNGKDACLVPVNVADPLSAKKIDECKFLGVPDQEESAFSFSAINATIFPRLNVGDAYSITVKKQPFGKICTVQNPTGTLQATNPEIHVTCMDDSSVPHYTVSVNTAAVSSTPGLRVTLITENGTCSIDANGLSSPIVFTPDKCRSDGGYHRNATYIFNNQLNLPNFQWQVRATVPGATTADARRNCFMTGGPVTNTGGNTGDNANSLTDLGETDATNRPTGNVSVTVSACGFTVTSQADYSRNFVPTNTSTSGSTTAGFTVPTIAGGDGVLLALRSQPFGNDVASAKITSFATSTTAFMVPDANGDPTGTPYNAQSDLNAFYEVVVKQSPAGMACVPGYSTTTGSQSTRSAGTMADAGAVLLRRPSSATVAQAWLVSRVIRCRNIPATTAARLRGTYGQFTRTTTTTTTGSTGAVAVSAPTVRNRNFLTFFEDGTYLFGSHSGTVGVEQGFYAYNTATSATAAPELQPASSINFIATTDTNSTGGINSSGATRLITNVVKAAGSPQTITGLVSDGTVNGYVSSGLTVAVNQGIGTTTAAKTYLAGSGTNLTTLIADINTASNPGAVAGFPVVAVASGTEIALTGPPGGVVFTGSVITDLGFPASVAAGQTVVTTNVNARLTRSVHTVVEWILEEVSSVDHLVTSVDAKDGAWVAMDWQRQPSPVEDRRRIFVYQHGLYNAVSVGVNGIANFMEACYVDEIGLTGSWTKQSTRSTAGAGSAASAGCSLRQYTIAAGETLQQVLDVSTGCVSFAPLTSTCTLLSATSGDFPSTINNVIMPDFPGRWPQSQAQDATDGRPVSLVDYELRPANSVPGDTVCPTVDKLTVWDTQHGLRKDQLNPPIPRIVLCRLTAN